MRTKANSGEGDCIFADILYVSPTIHTVCNRFLQFLMLSRFCSHFLHFDVFCFGFKWHSKLATGRVVDHTLTYIILYLKSMVSALIDTVG